VTNALLIIGLFGIAAGLMFLRKLPAVIALPLMAVGIGIIEVVSGRLSLTDVSSAIIADGAVRMADPMVISFFGGMVSLLLQKTGIAEHFVRRGAELAGDNPFMVALIMLAIVTLLFTTIGGLGAVIMVGTIILPILASLGIREYVASGLLLIGISLGGLLNANNWAVYRSVLRLDDATVSSYALSLFCVTAVGSILFVAVELLRAGTIRLQTIRTSLGWPIVIAAVVAGLWYVAGEGVFNFLRTVLQWVVGFGLAAIVVTRLAEFFRSGRYLTTPAIHWSSFLIPLVPLLLIVLYGIPFVTSFLLALVYGVIVRHSRSNHNGTRTRMVRICCGDGNDRMAGPGGHEALALVDRAIIWSDVCAHVQLPWSIGVV
jgi:hypothetical protein